MRSFNLPQNAFIFGEIDPKASGRYDKDFYQKSTTKLENFRLLTHGGVSRRPGTRYMAKMPVNDFKPVSFIFNETQQYAVLFSANSVDIYLPDGTFVMHLLGAWDVVQAKELTFAQTGDVMFIFHKDLRTQKLVRTGALTFEIRDFNFGISDTNEIMYQPYYRFEDRSIYLTPSARKGSTVVVTASAPIFSLANVGQRWRVLAALDDYREFSITSFISTTQVMVNIENFYGLWKIWESNVDYLLGDEIINGVNHYRCTKSGVSAVAPVHTTGELAEGNDTTPKWLFLDTGPQIKNWEEPAFSDIRGWPRCGTFHSKRLWIAASNSLPTLVTSSRIGFFDNFHAGTGLDDESIQGSVVHEQLDAVNFMSGGRHLLYFSNTAEFYSPEAPSRPLTPRSYDIKFQASYGARFVEPIFFDGATLYSSASGKSVRELLFDNQSQGYVSDDVSILSNHLINNPVWMAGHKGRLDIPEQLAFIINADGTMAAFNSVRSQRISGWTPWTTSGNYKSAIALDNTIYFFVERTVNGLPEVHMERIETSLTLDDAIELTGVQQTTWTGLSHLEGAVVDVVDSTAYFGQATVSGGLITLPYPSDHVAIGLNYTPIMNLHRSEFQIGEGALHNTPRRISKMSVSVVDSCEFSVDGQEVIIRTGGALPQNIIAPVTQDFNFEPLGWSRSDEIVLQQDTPLPLTITSITRRVVFR